MTSWRLIAAWLLALAVATLLTWEIVSFADSRVGATPVEIDSVASALSPTSSSTLFPQTSTSSTSTSSTGDSSVTSSTEAQSEDEWSLRTINTSGGAVVIRYRPGEVELQATTPAPGFDVEIDDAGPERVRLEFESDTEDIRVEAEWKDGALDVKVSESG